MSLFAPATKAQAKARVAISGPSGSGKTYTALVWATVLAEGGKIAGIDTERGSMSLYADRFEFDVLNITQPYHPDRLVEALRDAEAGGYRVVVIDSGSHFWNGPGGVLEIVDQAKARFRGNSHAAWQEGTPIQQRMIDALLSFNGHIIFTMRSKTEWAMETDDRGRVSPIKVGLSPQQRDGIEYEFTVMLDVDLNHRASVAKTRAELLTDKIFPPEQTEESAQMLLGWLNSGVLLIDSNTRDRLQQMLGNLTPAQRNHVLSAWSEHGLPKLQLLNEEQVPVVEQLVADAQVAAEQPDASANSQWDSAPPADEPPAEEPAA